SCTTRTSRASPTRRSRRSWGHRSARSCPACTEAGVSCASCWPTTPRGEDWWGPRAPEVSREHVREQDGRTGPGGGAGDADPALHRGRVGVRARPHAPVRVPRLGDDAGRRAAHARARRALLAVPGRAEHRGARQAARAPLVPREGAGRSARAHPHAAHGHGLDDDGRRDALTAGPARRARSNAGGPGPTTRVGAGDGGARPGRGSPRAAPGHARDAGGRRAAVAAGPARRARSNAGGPGPTTSVRALSRTPAGVGRAQALGRLPWLAALPLRLRRLRPRLLMVFS